MVAEQGNDHGRDNSVADRRSVSAARDRERDRDRQADTQMGPQETADWDDMMEKIHSRLSDLEANQRNHAQTLGTTHESANQNESSGG